jgi:hypothetical protein
MPTPPDPNALWAYLAVAFPRANLDTHPIDFGPAHLCFELGDRLPNGTEARVVQAADRATTLFGELFPPDEPLTVLIKNWDWARRGAFASAPGYLSSLLPGDPADRATWVVTEDRGRGETYSYEQVLLTARAGDLDARAIFRGKANMEMGFDPRIFESIYFVNPARGLVFYMYDDRGCRVFADRPARLGPLYNAHRDWLVDADTFDWGRMFDARQRSGGRGRR